MNLKNKVRKSKKLKLPHFVPRTKRTALFGTVGIVAAATLALIIVLHDSEPKPPEVNASKYGTSRAACDIFPANEANWLFNQVAVKSESKVDPLNQEVKASNCTYSSAAGANGKKTVASLTIQSPTSEASIAAVKQAFNAAKEAADRRDITGYGESGFWNYTEGKLHFLMNNVWYIVSYGPEGTSSGQSLDTAQEMADLFHVN